tara:strand:+ start:6277 stop:6417 length:141 start_codon:yes stop_codon:yes gene_type:complete
VQGNPDQFWDIGSAAALGRKKALAVSFEELPVNPIRLGRWQRPSES